MVSAWAYIPRLGDELDLGDDRILLDEFEERGKLVDLIEFSSQSGGEIEAESVNVHFCHPIAQGIHDQLQGVRMPDIK